MFQKVINTALATTLIISGLTAAPVSAGATVDEASIKRRKEVLHTCLLNIYLNQKRSPEAMKEYQALIALKPSDPKMHYDYGRFLAVMGKNSEAIAELKKAAQLNPGDKDINGVLGTTLVRAKQFPAGLDYLKKAVAHGGEEYRKTYEDAAKYIQAVNQREVAKKRQAEYQKKLKAQQEKIKASSDDDDDDDW